MSLVILVLLAFTRVLHRAALPIVSFIRPILTTLISLAVLSLLFTVILALMLPNIVYCLIRYLEYPPQHDTWLGPAIGVLKKGIWSVSLRCFAEVRELFEGVQKFQSLLKFKKTVGGSTHANTDSSNKSKPSHISDHNPPGNNTSSV